MSTKEEGVQAKFINNILKKITAEKFLSLEKTIVIQVQKAFRTPQRHNQIRYIPRHIIIKTLNIQSKERILKTTRNR
jgi:hypothetical protein